MAKAVTETPSEAPPGEAPARRRSPFRRRFLLAYCVLGLILGGALAGAAAFLNGSGTSLRSDKESGPAWSDWQPTAAGLQRANQIAQFVSRRYRLESGSQLVAARAGPLRVQTLPVSVIALRGPSGDDEDISLLEANSTLAYVLCGLGARCSIPEGRPTLERERLLRREALELALYTFTYMEGVNSVVTFLPPRPDAQPLWTIFFRRGDLRDELARPLRFTLPDSTPPRPDEIDPAEAVMIDRLTEPRRFRFQFQQLQDQTAVLVLDPPQPEGAGTGSGGEASEP